MKDNPYIIGKKECCKVWCQNYLTNKHILICPNLNRTNSEDQYTQLLNDSVKEEETFKVNKFLKNWNTYSLQEEEQKRRRKQIYSGIQYTVIHNFVVWDDYKEKGNFVGF